MAQRRIQQKPVFFHFQCYHQDYTIVLCQYCIQVFLPTSGGSQLPLSSIKEKKKKERKVTIIFFNQHSYERSLIIIALSTLELQSAFQTLTNESRIQGGKAWSSSILSFPTVMGFRLGLLQLQEQQKPEVSVAEGKEDSSIVLGSLYTGF